MNFDFHQPKDTILKKYIDYYYTGSINKFYFAYPHYNNPLAFIKNTEVTLSKYGVELESHENSTSKIIVAKKNVFPIYINPKNDIEEFCIVFKPFGLAQFTNSLSVKTETPVFILKDFEDFYIQNSNFFEEETENKISLIDSYLIQKLAEKNHLQHIISSIPHYNTENPKITDILSHIPLSLKTYNRAFHMNCGVTPVKFKRIIQFRNAIEKIKNNETNKLKEIAMDSGYYDQAAFNNEFKKMSHLLPKDFFKEIKINFENNIYFKY